MRPSDRQTGFTLPAVLAVTGVVTLIFLVAITALASLTAEAASARSRVRFVERALSAEAALTYLVATEPFAQTAISVGGSRVIGNPDQPVVEQPGGTIPVRIDGTEYAIDIAGPMVLQIQDQAGMINVPTLTDEQLSRLADRVGLNPSQARRLGPLMIDYADMDDLRQPNGAESADYGTPIPNRSMIRDTEWLSLLGVREGLDRPRLRSIRDSLASDRIVVNLNVNTATPATLAVVFGLNEQQIASVIRARASGAFGSFQAFAAAAGGTGLIEDSERLYTFPSSALIVTIRDGRSPWIYRARMAITPSALEQPVWIDQTELSEAPRRVVADGSNAVRFPYSPR